MGLESNIFFNSDPQGVRSNEMRDSESLPMRCVVIAQRPAPTLVRVQIVVVLGSVLASTTSVVPLLHQ